MDKFKVRGEILNVTKRGQKIMLTHDLLMKAFPNYRPDPMNNLLLIAMGNRPEEAIDHRSELNEFCSMYGLSYWNRPNEDVHYFAKIPGAKTFEEISVCPHCNAPTEEKSSGDEGWTFCSDGCGCLEGEKTVYKFVCSHCEEVVDEPKCDCK